MQTAENIIISSLLILALLFIRGLFWKKVSPVFIYSLWLLAANSLAGNDWRQSAQYYEYRIVESRTRSGFKGKQQAEQRT